VRLCAAHLEDGLGGGGLDDSFRPEFYLLKICTCTAARSGVRELACANWRQVNPRSRVLRVIPVFFGKTDTSLPWEKQNEKYTYTYLHD